MAKHVSIPGVSDYRLQIVHLPTGRVVTEWEPGLRVEKEFVEQIVDEVVGVGIMRTEARVKDVVRHSILKVLRELKSRVR